MTVAQLATLYALLKQYMTFCKEREFEDIAERALRLSHNVAADFTLERNTND